MNEVGMALSDALEEIASSRAKSLGEQFAQMAPQFVGAAALLVCEVEADRYFEFERKFKTGRGIHLRQLLDECWLAIKSDSPLPTPGVVENRLDTIGTFEDWDSVLTDDASISMSAMYEVLIQLQNAQSLHIALDALFQHAVRIKSDELINNLDEFSGYVQAIVREGADIPDERIVREMVAAAEMSGGDLDQFLLWIKKRLNEQNFGIVMRHH